MASRGESQYGVVRSLWVMVSPLGYLLTHVGLYPRSPVDIAREPVQFGTFSVSLSVTDMAASRAFYGKLGFDMVAGDGETWTIVANETTVIGLFQGMFEGNILTFNPGWEGMGEESESFTDVRQLRSQLAAAGVEATADTTGDTPNGPASFMISDPEGNVILIDQHV